MTAGIASEILWLAAPPVAGALVGWAAAEIAVAAAPRLAARRLSTERIAGRAGDYLRGERGRARIAEAVSSLTSGLLATPLGRLRGDSSRGPRDGRGVHEALRALLTSRAAIYAIRDLIARAVSSLAGRRVSEVADRLGLRRALADRILPLAAEEGGKRRISRALADLAVGRGTASAALPGALEPILASLLPGWVDRLMEWLRTEEMRGELARRGRELLGSTLEKLHAVQRLLVTAGQFDRRLDEKMPEIVEDALASLESLARSPENQKRFLAALRAALEDWLAGRSGSASEAGKAAETMAGLAEGFLSRFSDPGEREKTAALIEGFLLGPAGQSVGGLVRGLAEIGEGEIVERLSRWVLEYLTREETASGLSREISRAAERFASENSQVPVGDLLAVDGARKAGADALVSRAVNGLLEERLPLILTQLDIRGLALRAVRAGRGWVDAFGAAVGFLVGLAAAAVRLFGVS